MGIETDSIKPVFLRSDSVQLTPGATVGLDLALGEHYYLTPGENCTINGSNIVDGRVLYLVIRTSGTIPRIITFGTGFRSAGTLSTGIVSGLKVVLIFATDGGEIVEASRTGIL